MHKLYFILLGCKPANRNIEQHDVLFAIAPSLPATATALQEFWPEGVAGLHIDCWREVTLVDDYRVTIVPRDHSIKNTEDIQLFFINLGGYKPGEFEEYHYKMIVAARDKTEAIQKAKETAFYKHTGFKGAESHIDDKYGIDVDDIYQVSDILPAREKELFSINVTKREPVDIGEDELHIGYLTLKKLLKGDTDL